MSLPDDRSYLKTHEWVKIEGDTAVIGISDHAQDSLGDITFVELPAPGTKLTRGSEFGVVESVKAASDLYAPVSGEVSESNGRLENEPETVNASPYDEGWLIKLKNVDAADSGDLMDAAAYQSFLDSES